MRTGDYIWEMTPFAGSVVRYLYKSDWYTDHWVLSTDVFSTDIYGYAVDAAEDPSDIRAAWQGDPVVGTVVRKGGCMYTEGEGLSCMLRVLRCSV